MIPYSALKNAQKPRDGEFGVVNRESVSRTVTVSDVSQLQNALLPNTEVIVSPGRYEFPCGFRVNNLHDVRISGRGAVFVCNDNKFPVLDISSCARICVMGVRCEREQSIAFPGLVTDGVLTGDFSTTDVGCVISLDRFGNYLKKVSMEDVEVVDRRFTRLRPLPGICLVFRKRKGSSSTVFTELSEDISFVSVQSCGGLQMGFGFRNCTGLLVEACSVGRLNDYANRADGMHFQYCREVHVNNCDMRGCGDDGLNICSPLRTSSASMLEPWTPEGYEGFIDLAQFSARFVISNNRFHQLPRGIIVQAPYGKIANNLFSAIPGPSILTGRDDGAVKCGVAAEFVTIE